jgi:hypothetical protein
LRSFGMDILHKSLSTKKTKIYKLSSLLMQKRPLEPIIDLLEFNSIFIMVQNTPLTEKDTILKCTLFISHQPTRLKMDLLQVLWVFSSLLMTILDNLKVGSKRLLIHSLIH